MRRHSGLGGLGLYGHLQGRPHRRSRSHQRGLSGLLVLAVLVLLASVSAYAVGLVTSVHSGYARELSHSRASQAAQAGLDWGRYRVLAGAAPLCTAAQNITTLPGTLQPYTVTVRCTTTGPYTETGAPVRAYRLLATACNQPLAGQCPNAAAGADYVENTVSTLLTR
jgi:MSHA biogenesis protein MshP